MLADDNNSRAAFASSTSSATGISYAALFDVTTASSASGATDTDAVAIDTKPTASTGIQVPIGFSKFTGSGALTSTSICTAAVAAIATSVITHFFITIV